VTLDPAGHAGHFVSSLQPAIISIPMIMVSMVKDVESFFILILLYLIVGVLKVIHDEG
jgi:hypothetical protein